MHPLDKGSPACNFGHWGKARDPLVDAVGCYCSYCERPLDIPDIEHKANKANAKYQHRKLEWDNFLLACGYCNRVKATKDTEDPNVLFPDECNTAWAFEYLSNCLVRVNAFIGSPIAKQAAENTCTRLLELNRQFDTNGNRDLRWSKRFDVWREATQLRLHLSTCDSLEMRHAIVSAALGWGYFSVWMTVFASDTDMLDRFLRAFVGTNLICFDGNGQAKPTLTP